MTHEHAPWPTRSLIGVVAILTALAFFRLTVAFGLGAAVTRLQPR
jgi:hypothetical protein